MNNRYRVEVDGVELVLSSVATFREQPYGGEPAWFGSFTLEPGAEVSVIIETSEPVSEALVRPLSAAVPVLLAQRSVHLPLKKPGSYTLELNGRSDGALHLFANSPETEVVDFSDPKVHYFGPGVHELATLDLGDGETLYLAAGAWVKAVLPADETPTEPYGWRESVNYRNMIVARGAQGVRILGRGVLDTSALPWLSRRVFQFEGCQSILFEGITIVDAPGWGIALLGCRDVTIRNVKQLSHRWNSDCIDLSNCQNVVVEDCFLRSNDDEICVKTLDPPPAPRSEAILVRRCVIWNERARGLGITSETRADITNVTFEDCDIIHDFSKDGDCAALAVLVSDSGTVSDIVFRDIRIESPGEVVVRVWVGKDEWGQDSARGKIQNILFERVSILGKHKTRVQVLGYSSTHLVEGVLFRSWFLDGNPQRTMPRGMLETNAYVRNLQCE